MDWRVVSSARSKSDLQKIVEYISRDDSKAALRFGLRLIEHAESLAGAPEIGVPLRERPGTRFLPHGQYLIIYRTDGARSHDPNSPVLAWRAKKATAALAGEAAARSDRNQTGREFADASA
jgi:plasmid stabilization system protein ParE